MDIKPEISETCLLTQKQRKEVNEEFDRLAKPVIGGDRDLSNRIRPQ